VRLPTVSVHSDIVKKRKLFDSCTRRIDENKDCFALFIGGKEVCCNNDAVSEFRVSIMIESWLCIGAVDVM
jgi:hypothetical protein